MKLEARTEHDRVVEELRKLPAGVGILVKKSHRLYFSIDIKCEYIRRGNRGRFFSIPTRVKMTVMSREKIVLVHCKTEIKLQRN